ncbi:MAG: hypothetical protein ACJ74D_00290 [Gaiellaceae bacterium]
MRALVAVVICVLIAVSASAAASTTPQMLVREAARVSGFPPRQPIVTTTVPMPRYDALYARAGARAYPSTLRRADATAYAHLGLGARSVKAATPRAWYDISERTLLVQRRPAASRRALVHEVVRALIDQNYNLKRLLGLRVHDRDRSLAANAIVEGTAALSSGLRPAALRGTPLERFDALDASAGLGAGRTLAAQLRYLGGRSALVTALRTFPQTTEQLLHVDKFLERERALPIRLPAAAGGERLASSETFGELEVRNLLLALRVPAAAAVSAGWGGGRLALYGGVSAVVLRWDTAADAAEWQSAVPRYVAVAFPAASSTTCPPLDGCWTGPAEVAAGVYGTTSVFASGPGAAAVAAGLLSLK